MPKVTFNTDFTPKGQSPDIQTFKAGETYDLERSYAEKYIGRGLAVAFDPKAEREKKLAQAEAERATALAVKIEQRGKIIIPDDLSKLEWPAMRELAQSLSDDVIKGREDAMKAIEAEKARRSGT